MIQSLLTDEFVTEIAATLMQTFFVYIPTELEEWTSEPEEWEMKEEGDEDALENFVRPCAERLFLDILISHKQIAMLALVRMVETTRGNLLHLLSLLLLL